MVRLDKYLASASVGSRSEVKNYIKKGRVRVNGVVITKEDVKVSSEDCIEFDGKRILLKEGYVYYMLNKPAGVISATFDNYQKTVMDLLPKDIPKGVAPVGRLDKDTEGLLILTNDGEFNHQMMSPKKHVAKKYFARLSGACPSELVEEFRAGVDIGDDTLCKSAELEISDNPSEIYITITEGRYHQVKRMFLRYGLTVEYLKRLSVGTYELPENLKLGDYIEIKKVPQ